MRKSSSAARLTVSIHAPTGGATSRFLSRLRRARFQFTRPRGARPGDGYAGLRRRVSIHAPTGGATPKSLHEFLDGLFQFTRPRGARPIASISSRALRCFNSRAHGGRDCSPSPASRTRTRFNSRAHGGRDMNKTIVGIFDEFQFTRPRGARLTSRVLIASLMCFNSRAHGGRDSAIDFILSTCGCFNSRAHGGRDISHGVNGGGYNVSIHAPTGGATECR